MNISAPFVRRPVATTLLTVAVAFAGALAAFRLPAAPMPEFDYPAISVRAQMPGASPEVMATTVATPLERRLGIDRRCRRNPFVQQLGVYCRCSHLRHRPRHKRRRARRSGGRRRSAGRSTGLTALQSAHIQVELRPVADHISVSDFDDDESRSGLRGRIHRAAAAALLDSGCRGGCRSGLLAYSPCASKSTPTRCRNTASIWRVFAQLWLPPTPIVRRAFSRAMAEGSKSTRMIERATPVSCGISWSPIVRGSRLDCPISPRWSTSVDDFRPFAITGGQPSILIRVYRTSGANVIETVDRIKAGLEHIRPALPPALDVAMVSDRTATIRASLRDLEHGLVIGAVLVTLVVFAFLRSIRATLAPALAASVSLLGTAAVMYVMRYSLDNLSLMALIIAVGLVVDDSVIVLENISRHLERGTPRYRAVLRGVGEVGFTVVAISLSLVAIFIPFLFMGDLMGRVLAEFAVTLSAAVLISLIVSLTTTPMLCSVMLQPKHARRPGRMSVVLDAAFRRSLGFYDRTLDIALRHSAWTLATFFAILGLNVYLYAVAPKGLLPQQDPGRLYGVLQADQNISATAMRQKLERAAELIVADASVASFAAVIEEGARSNSAELYVELKPRPKRTETCHDVNARLSESVNGISGATLRLIAPQDIAGFSAQTNKGGEYQYDIRGDDITELQTWAVRLTAALSHVPEVRDLDLSPQPHALETSLVVDRDKAQRLGVDARQIDNVLYDAFGQRQVSTIHGPLNQHHIVMEVAPRFRENPDVLNTIYVSPANGLVGGVSFSNAPAGTVSASGKNSAGARAALATGEAARNQRLNALAN